MQKGRSGGKDTRGQVPIATVTHDKDDRGVLHRRRQLLRHPARARRRDAGKNSFFASQAPTHVLGIGLTDVDQFVDQAGIVNARQLLLWPLADARNA